MTTPCFVYFIQAGERGPIKIGTTNNVAKRIRGMQTGCNETLNLLLATEGGVTLERKIHSALAEYRTRGEWFAPSDAVMAAMRALPPIAANILYLPLKQRTPKSPLHAWRMKRGMTIDQAAAALGFCKGFISDLENGKAMPAWPTMEAIHKATGGAITPNDFAPFLRPAAEVKSA